LTGFDDDQRAVAVTEKKALGDSWRKDRACVEKLGDVRWGSFLMWREIIFSTAYSYVGVYVVGTYSK